MVDPLTSDERFEAEEAIASSILSMIDAVGAEASEKHKAAKNIFDRAVSDIISAVGEERLRYVFESKGNYLADESLSLGVEKTARALVRHINFVIKEY